RITSRRTIPEVRPRSWRIAAARGSARAAERQGAKRGPARREWPVLPRRAGGRSAVAERRPGVPRACFCLEVTYRVTERSGQSFQRGGVDLAHQRDLQPVALLQIAALPGDLE